MTRAQDIRTGSTDDGHPRRWSILTALCAALLVIVVDNTVLAVALPAIAEDFDAGTTALQAVVDAYVVVFAGLLVAAGVAADRFGRRRTLLLGLLVFGLASGAAAVGLSVWWLIGMRALMGVGAAFVMPSTLAVLVQVFPPGERARAFAVWAAVASVAMAVGPVLGGVLVSAWSWAGVFLINVPVVLVAMVSVARLVPESRDPDPGRFDVVSAALVTMGIAGLTLAVIALGESGAGSPAVGSGALVSVLALAAFGRRQHRSPSPMVQFSLYRSRTFTGASAAAALLTLGTGSALFVITQYLQLVRGMTAWQAGIAVAPLALGVVLGSALGGRAPARIGSRTTIAIGFATTASGFLVLAALAVTTPFPLVAVALVLLGLGTGFSGPAVTSAVLGAVPPARSGMGSALHDTHQQLGIALGVAASGSLLATRYRAQLPDDVTEHAAGSIAATLTEAATRPDGGALADTARAAFTSAQATTMSAAAACTLAGGLAAFVLLGRDDTRR